ncbi:MAG: 30S ribosomal protein S21 [Bacteriovoracaceae bacterium]|nr:30S ribosomal protein S21 [Bacteriovoracaceae bacterium]
MAHTLVEVRVDEKLGTEKALKKFKRLCENFGVVKEFRKRQNYSKPSVRLKEKREAAEKRRHKTNMKTRYSSNKI